MKNYGTLKRWAAGDLMQYIIMDSNQRVLRCFELGLPGGDAPVIFTKRTVATVIANWAGNMNCAASWKVYELKEVTP